jgi:hypothetical protein
MPHEGQVHLATVGIGNEIDLLLARSKVRALYSYMLVFMKIIFFMVFCCFEPENKNCQKEKKKKHTKIFKKKPIQKHHTHLHCVW